MNILWFLLPGVLYLGIVTSYTDIKYGKIKNRDIFIGLGYAFIVYLLVFVFLFIKSQLNYMYFLEIFTNAVFALAVAFGLWYYKIWSAGDGKLFFAFALLVSPEAYLYGRHNWVPSITLLINVFIVGLFVMVFSIIRNAKQSHYKKVAASFFKDFFSFEKLFQMLASLFAVFWLIEILLSFFGMEESYLLRYVLTMAVMTALPFLSSKYLDISLYVTIAISLLRLAIDKSVYSFGFLWQFLLLVFVWRLLRGVFKEGVPSIGKELFLKEIHVKNLKPGMILSERIIQVKKMDKLEMKIFKKNLKIKKIIVNKGKYSYFFGNFKYGKDYLGAESEGLTKSEINKIKNIGFKKVTVSSTIAFAPIMFIGVLSLLAAKGNVLILLRFLGF